MPTGTAALAVALALILPLPQGEWRGCGVRRGHANLRGVPRFAAL